MGEGAIAGLVMGMDSWGRKEPVVVRVSADAQGDLVNYSASLWVRKTVTVLDKRRWRRRRRQDGLCRVMSSSEGTSRLVGKKRVCGQALGMCRGRARSVCRAAVWQVGKGVCVDSRGDVGMWTHRPVVAVPIFVAVAWHVELHLGQKTHLLSHRYYSLQCQTRKIFH